MNPTNPYQINSARVQRRYAALSLPLSEAMLVALKRHQDAHADAGGQASPPPPQDSTDNGCRGAWHE